MAAFANLAISVPRLLSKQSLARAMDNFRLAPELRGGSGLVGRRRLMRCRRIDGRDLGGAGNWDSRCVYSRESAHQVLSDCARNSHAGTRRHRGQALPPAMPGGERSSGPSQYSSVRGLKLLGICPARVRDAVFGIVLWAHAPIPCAQRRPHCIRSGGSSGSRGPRRACRGTDFPRQES